MAEPVGERTIPVTPEQARYLAGLHRALADAQKQWSTALSVLAAGHGIVRAEVVAADLEGEEPSITVRVSG